MTKVLLPIFTGADGTGMLNHLKKLFSPTACEIILLSVRTDVTYLPDEAELYKDTDQSEQILALLCKLLDGYTVKKEICFGNPAEEILSFADENHVHVIVLNRTHRHDHIVEVLLKNADCGVLLLPTASTKK